MPTLSHTNLHTTGISNKQNNMKMVLNIHTDNENNIKIYLKKL